MKYIYSLLILSILSINTAYSQNDRTKHERIEAKKIAFISQKLDLSPQEATVFWPVYNQHQKNNKSIKEKYNADFKIRDMSEAALEVFIDNTLNKETDLLDERKKYITELKKVISNKQIVTLYKTEKQFKTRVLKEVRKRMNKRD